MLLTVDIGNTSTKFGIFDGDTLRSKLAIPTIRDVTARGLANVLRSRLLQPITTAIVCSVVPEANAAMLDFLQAEYRTNAALVSADFDFGLDIRYEPLSAAGTDRLVNAFAAAKRYGAPCIVCSLGTALTIDVVSDKHVLVGGLIAPGMKTMARALHLNTAKLPEVEIERTDSVIQNTTAGSIRSGIFHGYLSMVEGLIDRFKNEIGDHTKVIGTGGFASMFAENSKSIDIVDGDLLLCGLQMLHARSFKS